MSNPIEEIAKAVGGKIEESALLPDGSGFAVMSMPLPPTHWIYGDPSVENKGDNWSFEPPPMTMRMGTDDPNRAGVAEAIRKAARYAIRASTGKGKDMDFDPDAMVQNMVTGLLGYHTPDGLDRTDSWANPSTEDH